MPLSQEIAANAKPKDAPYKLGDGNGLYLLISPNGGKYWRMDYRFDRKQKTLALGVYPDTTLDAARQKCEESRSLLKNNIDPGEVRKAEKEELRRITPTKRPALKFSLNADGALLIETKTNKIRLTDAQVTALRHFLDAATVEQEIPSCL